jgi:hypothetical protein
MLNTGRLIYSHRESDRVERQKGGGSQPASRMDYRPFDLWDFYHSDDRVGFPDPQRLNPTRASQCPGTRTRSDRSDVEITRLTLLRANVRFR